MNFDVSCYYHANAMCTAVDGCIYTVSLISIISYSERSAMVQRIVFFFTVAVLFLCNCASISNFSTARPVGRGNGQITAALSRITTISDTIPLIEKIPEFYFFELLGTIGITDRFDLGVKYTFPAAGFLEGKYCFVSNDSLKGMFLSPALRAGYTSFPHDSGSTNNRFEISVPVYFSFFPSPLFGITVAPVYSGRFFMRNSSSVTHCSGTMLSMSIGKRIGVILEGDYLYNFTWKWHEIQAGIALFIPVKNLFSSLIFSP